MRYPDVEFGTLARILVEGGHSQDDVRLGKPFCEDMGPATGAKPPQFPGRGLMGPQHGFSAGDPEMAPQNPYRGRIGARMRLPACGAVAMRDRHVELINLVSDLSA
jgi:hypothetical protein